MIETNGVVGLLWIEVEVVRHAGEIPSDQVGDRTESGSANAGPTGAHLVLTKWALHGTVLPPKALAPEPIDTEAIAMRQRTVITITVLGCWLKIKGIQQPGNRRFAV
jgi:hypothetical protein